MGPVVGPYLEPGDRGRRMIEDDAIGGVAVPARRAGLDLLRREDAGGRPDSCTPGVEQSDVEVGPTGVVVAGLADHRAGDRQAPVALLKPDLFDGDGGRIHSLELDVGGPGRRPEGSGAAGEGQRSEEEGKGFHGGVGGWVQAAWSPGRAGSRSNQA